MLYDIFSLDGNCFEKFFEKLKTRTEKSYSKSYTR